MRIKLLLCLFIIGLGLVRAAHAGLQAAAGKVDITPDLSRESILLAGYGAMGRKARGVHDPLRARALVVSDGIKTVAFVAVDFIGVFREDVLDMRRQLGWNGNSKFLFVAATHDHSAPDTLGLWGRLPGMSGVNPRYHRRWKEMVVGLVRDLSEHMEPVEMTAAKNNINPRRLCRDSRDPVVLDPELDVLEFASQKKRSARSIATLVRWSCHATTLDMDNRQVTADYPGSLCDRVEEMRHGTCVFFNGIIGGHLVADVDERIQTVEHRYAESKRIGQDLGDQAIDTLLHRSEKVLGAPIEISSLVLRVPVENSRFLLFLRSLIFGHRLLDKNGNLLPSWKSWWLPLKHLLFFPLPADETPWVETEISHIRLGSVDILGIPGEMFPELAIGGYDGRYRFGYPLLRSDNDAPPDLKMAPKGPYIKDKLHSRHGLLIGLANDELGYFVPDYDFKVAPTRSMTPRMPGDHYEETFSLGSSVTGILLRGYDELLGTVQKAPLLKSAVLTH